MSETVAGTKTIRRRETGHERPYVLVVLILGAITAGEILFFTPVDIVPEQFRILGLLSSTQRVLALMGFAAVKAGLVAAYYMHLKYESKWIKIIPILPLLGVLALVLSVAFR